MFRHRTSAPARMASKKSIRNVQAQTIRAYVDSAPLARNGILQLQRQLGNQAVVQLMSGTRAAARQPVTPVKGNFPFIQRVKLADTKHIKRLLEQDKAEKKADPFNFVGGVLKNEVRPAAAQEILGLNKRDLVELLDDINLEQLATLEGLIAGLTAKIDNLFSPQAAIGAAGGVVQTIAGIGQFRVVPDGTQIGEFDYETITQGEFDRLQADWSDIKASSGSIMILEWNNDPQHPVPGFRDKVIAALGALLLRPTGRRIVQTLKTGAHYTTIKPAVVTTMLTPARGAVPMGQTVVGNVAGATPFATAYAENLVKPGGLPGAGAGSTIEIDPNLNDDTLKAYDRDGRALKTPVFLALGHELAHALHNARGINKRQLPGPAGYPNLEEKVTIEGEENRMRLENLERRLGKRFGHAGSDDRIKSF